MLQYAMLALSAVQAISSMSQGKAEEQESIFNANLIREKIDFLNVQKDINTSQYRKLAARTWGTSSANVGAMGIMQQGGALAAMLSAQKNIMIDQTISNFNIDMEKRYTEAEAQAQERQGKIKKKAGYSNAFSSILSGVSNYAMYTKGLKV